MSVKYVTNGSGSGEVNRRRPHVVIVGAGFGGLRAAKALRKAPVDVTVVDRRNFHTFLPLLYEVASAGLKADDIAQPVRAILRGSRNVRFRMADVQRIDLDGRRVITDTGVIAYDYLILSAGSATNFFGMRAVAERALGLKDLAEATAVRNRVLRSFEQATLTADPAVRHRLMTTVIVGGGPTGVELAGAMAELKRHVLPRDYPDLDLSEARVILVEASGELLAALPLRLRRKGLEQLVSLGVEVRLNAQVSDIDDGGVVLKSGDRIESANVVWVAGVRGETLGEAIDGVELGPGRRIRVEPTMRIAGRREAYAVGDIAYLEGRGGRPYPMLAQVAMQQASFAAANIMRDMCGEAPKTFRYHDRGTMATIGRRKAVAEVFGLQFSGLLAWMLWLTVHLIALIGLRNRVVVLLNWIWNYFQYDRANRLVTDEMAAGELQSVAPARPAEPVSTEARRGLTARD